MQMGVLARLALGPRYRRPIPEAPGALACRTLTNVRARRARSTAPGADQARPGGSCLAPHPSLSTVRAIGKDKLGAAPADTADPRYPIAEIRRTVHRRYKSMPTARSVAQTKTPPERGFPYIGETGFEPATARPPAGCATRLRHSPWSGLILSASGIPGQAPPGRKPRRPGPSPTRWNICSWLRSGSRLFSVGRPSLRRCGGCRESKSVSDLAWGRRDKDQGDQRPQLAASDRRDAQVRRRLCKLSSSPDRSTRRFRPRGGSSTVEPRPSKAMMRVRFPSAA
jgi:hypothetical protein